MADWQNDPACSEENLLSNLAHMGNAPEPIGTRRGNGQEPHMKAAELYLGKGLDFAKMFAQQEHNAGVTSGEVAKASYWQAVIVRLTQIEQEKQRPDEAPIDDRAALRAV